MNASRLRTALACFLVPVLFFVAHSQGEALAVEPDCFGMYQELIGLCEGLDNPDLEMCLLNAAIAVCNCVELQCVE